MWKIGDNATCKHCREQIEYHGEYWVHTRTNPRHPGEPESISISKGDTQMTDRMIFKSPVNNRAACLHRGESLTIMYYDLLEYAGEVGGLPVFKVIREKADLSGFLAWLGIDVVTYAATGLMFGERSE